MSYNKPFWSHFPILCISPCGYYDEKNKLKMNNIDNQQITMQIHYSSHLVLLKVLVMVSAKMVLVQPAKMVPVQPAKMAPVKPANMVPVKIVLPVLVPPVLVLPVSAIAVRLALVLLELMPVLFVLLW